MPQSVKENLLAAFRYLLKPLVRLAVKNGVTYPEFSEALKQAYVDIGSKQLSATDNESTVESISLMASVPAHQVREILNMESGNKYGMEAQQANPLPTILAAWHTDQRYTGPYGVLRDLQFSKGSVEGESAAAGFAELVAAYCPGVSPKALLDELVRTGAVQEVGNGYFRAIKRSYIPDPLSAQSILLFARVVHNVCETLEVNLRSESAGGRGLIERSVYTVHGISKQDHQEFDKFIRLRGQVFADDIDNWLANRDVEGVKEGVQMGVGFYHYIVNEEDERALSKELPH